MAPLVDNVAGTVKACGTFISLPKEPAFQKIVDTIDRNLKGRMNAAMGNVFEEVFAKLLPNAERGVRLSTRRVDRFNADFVDSGFVHQVKSGQRISGSELEQLNHTVEYAERKRLTAVYHFLRRPAQDTIDKITAKGAVVVHYFDD